jgi:hypothetical protein
VPSHLSRAETAPAAAARCPKLKNFQPDKSLKNYTKDDETQM